MAVDPDKPFNREEMYLAKAAGEGTTVPDEPWSRKEAYLDKISGRLDGMEDQIELLASDLSFKGSVADEAHLPSGAAVGDTYITEDTGVMYVWTGTDWTALGGTGINVVQTAGTSTTDVMSQNAASSLVYQNPGSTSPRVRIGNTNNIYEGGVSVGVGASAGGQFSVCVGNDAATLSSNTVSVGKDSATQAGDAIAVGHSSRVTGGGGIAIGAFSSATLNGEMNIGLPRGTASDRSNFGYNNTAYRLISGVHDPVNAHDAATKGYVDGLVGNVEAALNAINNGGNA